jgi:hypothetical protein
MLSELIEELVSEVSHYKRLDLGEREAEFLARIGEGHNSSYKIYFRCTTKMSTKDTRRK